MKRETGFWDASALVPLCVHEGASRFARQELRRYEPVVWWGTGVEMYSAICRLQRAKEITQKEWQGASLRLHALRAGWREILPADDVRDLAEQLLTKYELRAADSLQLAAALNWCGQRPARRVFLCGDERLCRAAATAGFAVIEFPGTAR